MTNKQLAFKIIKIVPPGSFLTLPPKLTINPFLTHFESTSLKIESLFSSAEKLKSGNKNAKNQAIKDYISAASLCVDILSADTNPQFEQLNKNITSLNYLSFGLNLLEKAKKLCNELDDTKTTTHITHYLIPALKGLRAQIESSF
ncbi:MAG: hypothetical protein WC501_02320 [Candidatus Micrarchaeia archaeon]